MGRLCGLPGLRAGTLARIQKLAAKLQGGLGDLFRIGVKSACHMNAEPSQLIFHATFPRTRGSQSVSLRLRS